jgi:phage terminase small subunit
MAKLTPKQEMFCREYLVDLNGAAAAVRAGYSEKTANRIASENLSKPDIMERVAELKQERIEKVARTAQDVLNDIIAVTAQARDDGDLKTALKGLELQGKHLGMFTDNVRQEVSGPGGGPLQSQNEIVVRFVEAGHGD